MENIKSKRNIQPFNGENYNIWKFRIRSLFNELEVIHVIDKPEPANPDSKWKKSESTAKNALIEYLSDSYLSYVKPESSTKQIFAALDNIFERKSVAKQLGARKKLFSLKLEGDTDLCKHFMQFDSLISELASAGATISEVDKVTQLLLTLPPSYNGVITAIETLSEDNITLSFVKTRLLDHEVKLVNENLDTSKKVLHVEQKTNDVKRYNKEFRKPWKNHRGIVKPKHNGANNKKHVKCHHCGRRGHYKNECRYYLQSLKPKPNAERPRTVQSIQADPLNGDGFAFMAGNFQLLNERNKISFLLDSGASDHLINREDLADTFADLQTPIKISIAKNGAFITATKMGTIVVTSNMGVQGKIENVLYSPDVPYNLLSVYKMQQVGYSVNFSKPGVIVSRNGKTVMTGKPKNNLFTLEFSVSKSFINYSNNASNSEYKLWHQRLGHIGKDKFDKIRNKQLVDDVERVSKIIPDDYLCEACINGKQARLSFNKFKNKDYIERPLFNIHSDVCGPITPSAINNKNYFVLFVDEFTHYCVTYLMKNKSDVFTMFKDYVAKSESRFNLKIVNLYTDNGREYLSNEMKDYCIQKGISYHLTVPRTPQLNGVSERMVRTITEKARTMISGAKLEKVFWGDAVLTATYLINMTPTKSLNANKTPYEMWYNKKPQLKYLKVFGSTVYAHVKTSKNKFDEKSSKGILVGYEPNGYRVYEVENDKYVVVRDVIVDETNFIESRPKIKVLGEVDSGGKTVVPNDALNSVDDPSTRLDNNKTDSNNSIEKQTDNSSSQDSVELRRSNRLKGRSQTSYNEDDTSFDYLLCAQSIVCPVPNSYEEIKNRNDAKQWQKAINDELNSLLINKTWTLVPKPSNTNIVDCKWIFTIKNDEFGNPLKYKARLVARGFSQKYLVDYDETFAPVARISTFRFLIAFSNQHGLLAHQMDVKTAFLNGELKEEIYMRVPEGVKSEDNQVCKLNKALYGLKQAARCWFELFEKTLLEKGFTNSYGDRCMYILNRGDVSKNIYVVLYVDDLVICTADENTMQNFKNYLMNKFSMVDLKEVKFFLGIRVTRQNNITTLDQSTYIKTVLEKFNMAGCNPVSTPLECNLDYEALESDEKYDAPCRSLIGCLMYLMVCTRPDLTLTVSLLSRYMNKNNRELWQCLKRVLRYLQGTINLKLKYVQGTYNNIFTGYVDSNWGGNDNPELECKRKSTTGYLFKLYDRCTICWNTKRQASVAGSSTEAEYMALYEAVKEAKWLKTLAAGINLETKEPILIYEDNTGCISIANNPTSHKRSKHIDIKYHFSRDQCEKKVIIIKYISTDQQIADMLTKPLPKFRFLELRAKMALED